MAVSCNVAELRNAEPTPIAEPSEFVTVHFGVRYVSDNPWVATKAFDDDPQITSLRLAVFANNFLEYYVLATAEGGHATQNGIENRVEYTAKLPVISDPVHIHFLGNAPTTLDFGDEVSIIGGLTTTGGQDAYWQMVELPDGVTKNEATGELSDECAALLDDIPLIRNFAKVTVTASQDSDLTLEGAFIIYDTDRGTYAPYNKTTRSFINDYQDYHTATELIDAGYDSTTPRTRQLNDVTPTVEQFNEVDENGAAYQFIYERETPTANPAYVLVQGKYKNDASSCYYKVDLKGDDDNYFPILRNFNYKINIKKVYKRGAATPEDARNMSGSGDISTSIENNELTNISNGVSRIFVSYTDTTVVTTDAIHLKYKFIPDMENASDTPANGEVSSPQGYVVISLGNADEVLGPAITSYSAASTVVDEEGFSIITINPAEPGTSTNSQSIVIKGYVSDGDGGWNTIQRTVTVYVREVLTMIVECDPNEVPKVKNSPVDVILKIPSGLPRMMFPLEITLEAQALTLTPNNDNLPVVSGKSIINNNKTAFAFSKEISWDEYEATDAVIIGENSYKSFTCHFKTNTEISASRVYAANQYFITSYGAFTNFDYNEFSNLTFTPSTNLGLDSETRFTFTMPVITRGTSPLEVIVTLDGFEPGDDEEGLEYIGDVDGLPQYKYIPDDSSCGFDLVATAWEGQGIVKLSAYHYLDAEKGVTLTPTGSFSNLNYSRFVGSGVGATTNFTFNLSSIPATGVTVTLEGLEPQAGETHLVSLGNNQYTFAPSSTSATLALKSTTASLKDVKVTLSAKNFESASKKYSKKIKIYAQSITFTNATNNRLFGNRYTTAVNGNVVIRENQYDSDLTSAPRTAVSTTTRTQNYTTYYTFKNTDYTEIDVEVDATRLYFIYNLNGTYYVASTDISDLEDDEYLDTQSVTFTTRKTQRTLTVDDKTMTVGETSAPTSHLSAGTGTVTYTSGNSNAVTVSGTNLVAKKAGVYTVHASVAESNDYSGAETDFTVTVNKGTVTITPTKNSIRVNAGANGTIQFTYTDAYTGGFTATSNNANCTVVSTTANNGSGTVTVTGVNNNTNSTITISANGNADYNAGGNAQVTVNVKTRSTYIYIDTEGNTTDTNGKTNFVTVGGGKSAYNTNYYEPVAGETARLTVYAYDSDDDITSVKTGNTNFTKGSGTVTIDGLAYTPYYLDVPTTTKGSTNYTVTVTNSEGGTASGNGTLKVWDITRGAVKATLISTSTYYVMVNRSTNTGNFLSSNTNKDGFANGSAATATTGLALRDLWKFSGTASGTIYNQYANKYIYTDSAYNNAGVSLNATSRNWNLGYSGNYWRFTFTSGNNTYYLERNGEKTCRIKNSSNNSRQFTIYSVTFVEP